MNMVCNVLGEEEEAAEEEDEDGLQLDGLSSSPGKTGLCSADADSLSPGEDADSKGEREKCGNADLRVLTRDWICYSKVLP